MDEKKTCQVCGRAIKASNGFIAHHGYKRPEWGWQTPSCEGAKYPPYEISCDRLREVIEQVASYLAKQETEQNEFLNHAPDILISYEKNRKTGKQEQREYQKPANFDPANYYGSISNTYGCAYTERKYHYKSIIKAVAHDLAIMRERLENWKPPV